MINQLIQWRKAKLVNWYGYMLNWHKSNIKYMAMNEREFKINVFLSPPLLRQLTRRVWAIVSISLWPPLGFMLSHMLPDAMLYCENCEKQYREHPCGRNLALKLMKRLCESPDGKKPASLPPPRNIWCRVFVILMSPAFSHSLGWGPPPNLIISF